MKRNKPASHLTRKAGLICSIRTSGEKQMSKCENTQNVTVLGKNKDERTAILFNPRCKQWSCNYCAELNKDYWIHQATRGAILITSEGRELQFVTLTSRPYASPNQSLYFMAQNWPKLNRRAKYHTNKWKDARGIEWAYFLVPEKHKDGRVHAHLIAATHIYAKKFWKNWAFGTGFGFIMDVQTIENPAQVTGYVTKYMHKGSGAETWPKNFRRVRTSANWPITKQAPLDGWEWLTIKNPDTAWIEKNALIDMGWNVQDKRENE